MSEDFSAQKPDREYIDIVDKCILEICIEKIDENIEKNVDEIYAYVKEYDPWKKEYWLPLINIVFSFIREIKGGKILKNVLDDLLAANTDKNLVSRYHMVYDEITKYYDKKNTPKYHSLGFDSGGWIQYQIEPQNPNITWNIKWDDIQKFINDIQDYKWEGEIYTDDDTDDEDIDDIDDVDDVDTFDDLYERISHIKINDVDRHNDVNKNVYKRISNIRIDSID